ncbi:MAG: putative transposase [Mucilaginibacter sp.]|nr:putative transposase [Mucilaginibacter sp.]
MLYCPYKAWRLSKEEIAEISGDLKNGLNIIAVSAWQISQQSANGVQNIVVNKSSKQYHRAKQLLTDTATILSKDQSPSFYKIPQCSACQFKNDCYQKLKERDCISLLAAMTPKAMAKYHNKGITTITQLSHLFKPRRRRAPNPQSSYLWELKALAIREQKTFILQPPVFDHGSAAIFLDFEGTSNENHIYLLGGLIFQDGKQEKSFSLWSDHKGQEEENFKMLFSLLHQYPDAAIYHYGSYETKALKMAVKKWAKSLKHWPAIEKRMVNLLGYLRTHVYPPTYGNGLKELGAFLSFKWSDPEADGFLSIVWRRQWEDTQSDSLKKKLIRYNQDDCSALYYVHRWFCQLAAGADQEHVQQVAQMKKYTPYHLQNNLDYGEDFQKISKAAYFDYQRNKIYWRNELKRQTPAATSLNHKPKTRKGTIAWQPKKANEVIIVPPLKKCPHCGNNKLYQSRTTKTSVKQTDLQFTASGIRQHVTEYRSGTAKCAKCGMKTGNKNLRMMHYGDNLFALVINYYVNYHISNAMISNLIQEHYGIWISPFYLVSYKNSWWNRAWTPVADYIRTIVLNCPVIHIDETTIKLARESGYVWVFATTHTVFYHYAPTREVGFLQELLKGYRGIIISDFYPGYDTLNVKSQKCLIHLIRDLNDDLFKNQFDAEYKAIVAAFSKLLRKMIETIDKHGLKKTHLEKHITDTELFFKEFIERDYKSELSLKYTKRFKKHWDQLWTFLHHDNVPWNNNNAEAAVKAFAQHRRGVKGQMHVKGINEFLQMLTVAQTCRYRNISFLDFLRRKRGIWENVQPEALPGFLPFDQGRLYIGRLGFERKKEWNEWKGKGNRPAFIPSSPERTYKNEGWVDWHDWIGFDVMPFEKARTFMRKLRLKNRDEYWTWLASGKRPKNIPYSPEKVYKHTGWIDLGDWLGTGNKSGRQKRKWLSYAEAKAYVQALGLKTQLDFVTWRKRGNKPETMPSDPSRSYAEFENWGKFLGTDRIANQCKIYWDYEEARAFLKPLYIHSLIHYRQLHQLGVIAKEIPKNPYAYYKKQGAWVSYPDFLSHEMLK